MLEILQFHVLETPILLELETSYFVLFLINSIFYIFNSIKKGKETKWVSSSKRIGVSSTWKYGISSTIGWEFLSQIGLIIEFLELDGAYFPLGVFTTPNLWKRDDKDSDDHDYRTKLRIQIKQHLSNVWVLYLALTTYETKIKWLYASF